VRPPVTNKQAEAPATPYAIAFIDGQNLYHCAKEAFGYEFPNYDPRKLAETVCAQRGWKLTQVRFYSGVPPKDRNPWWHEYWSRKKTRMVRAGVEVFTRPLRYAAEFLEDGTTRYIPREKGIDVRIAIDVLTLAIKKSYDVAVIFSQDQDLAEVAKELRDIAFRQNRWLKVASAYPVGSGTDNSRGINGSDWIRLSKGDYDACIDPAE
jgi:uncharacterized LabA/DUF88 family protein